MRLGHLDEVCLAFLGAVGDPVSNIYTISKTLLFMHCNICEWTARLEEHLCERFYVFPFIPRYEVLLWIVIWFPRRKLIRMFEIFS